MEQAVLFDGPLVPYKNNVTLVQIDVNTFKVKVQNLGRCVLFEVISFTLSETFNINL